MTTVDDAITGSLHFWISLSLRPKTETKWLKFGFSPKFGLTHHCIAHHCLVHNVVADVIADISVFINQQRSEVIFIHQNLISNSLTYLMHD